MNWFEAWLDRIYKPTPKPWKRKALFWLSLFILVATVFGGYTQHIYAYSGIEIWWVYGFFAALGLAGMLISMFGSEFWVALFLGGI